jgi:hypothetical protein
MIWKGCGKKCLMPISQEEESGEISNAIAGPPSTIQTVYLQNVTCVNNMITYLVNAPVLIYRQI